LPRHPLLTLSPLVYYCYARTFALFGGFPAGTKKSQKDEKKFNMIAKSLAVLCCWLSLLVLEVAARPVVRSIKSTHEWDMLLEKHATETGLPVVADFYSDHCGPCRMMAPIFTKVAKEMVDKAVFVKVDTNVQNQLSRKYGIRSLPTFIWFVDGHKWKEMKGGIGEGPLRQTTEEAIRYADSFNIKLEYDDLKGFYNHVDPSKTEEEILSIYQKCTDLKTKKTEVCQGAAALNLIRKLRQKYKKVPYTGSVLPRDRASATEKPKEGASRNSASGDARTKQRQTSSKTPDTPNLHLATKEQLMAELEKRLDEEREQEVESEDFDEEDALEDNPNRWVRGQFPERVVIVGGGPAGMASAIYAARAGLTPLVIAPSMGGQLQGKGVDVENYPGLHNMTGPGVIASMRSQAAKFGAVFEEDMVVSVDASTRPLKVVTNNTGAIETHTIIVATGADSKWLGIAGEYELRGGGVSSCATCDGYLFSGRHVVVVGGGDTAMEDALVLARTSKKVTLIHRRDTFRASKVLADRVKNNPVIDIQWNTVVEKIEGKPLNSEGEEIDLDDESVMTKVVSGVVLKDVVTGETRNMDCDAVFVAIGHSPNTRFLEGVVEFDTYHTGYIKTDGRSTKTSVPGIFAAGDVSDAVYRQAITSAGTGAAAALDAERYLSEEGLGNEAAEFEAELLAELAGEMNGESSEKIGYNVYEEAGGRLEGIRESVAAGSEL